MLQVTDQRVVPIDDIECAVWTKLNIDWTEVSIVAIKQRFNFRAEESRAFLFHRVLQNGSLANHIIENVIPLSGGRKMGARNDFTT